jgi:protocatechuate 3,4-dioxygenase beta subunit
VPPAPIEIGNYVWEDTDGDGIQDPGESPIADVNVTLYDENGNELGSTMTNQNGEYYFGGLNNTGGVTLAPHTRYQIRIALNDGNLNGKIPTTKDANNNQEDQRDSDGDNGVLNPGSSTIDYTTGGPGQNDHTLDFGFVPPAAIGDYVWEDANRNGIQDNGESGVKNVKVRLYKDGVDTGLSAMTDSNGHYKFTGLAPDHYHLVFDLSTLPPGYVVTLQNQGNDENNDSDADPSTGETEETTLGAGEEDWSWDMGIHLSKVSIGSTVFYDLNDNGLQDSNESG